MLTQSVRKLVNTLGYDLVRLRKTPKVDLSAYHELCSKETLVRKPFYNVGAGSFRHPYWTNVDNPSDWYQGIQRDQAMIAYDLLAGVPFPVEDGQALIFYTSHTMEHIPNAAASYFYREAYRSLAAGGLLRVTVPDVDLFYQAFRADDRHLDNMVQKYTQLEKAERIGLKVPADKLSRQQRFLWRIATSVSTQHRDGSSQRMTDEDVDRAFDTLPLEEALDFCTSKCEMDVQARHPGNHVNWWNWDKLSRFLREAGFSNVRRCGFGQSASPLMRDTRLFDNTHPEFSLYVEARK